MGYAYTPGLKVLAATTIRRCRRLPLPGAVLVRAGDRVSAEQVVMRTELPGPADMVNLVSMLGVMPAELPRYVVRKVGDSIAKGDLLAESKGFLGLFKTRIEAPMAGMIEAISPVTGQMTVRSPAVPVEVHAYIDGVIAEVVDTESVTVETSGAFIQGIFGVGGETNGVVAMIAERPDEPMNPARITPAHKGAVLVGGSHMTIDALRAATAHGVRALIAGGIDDADLKQFLGYELGVAITGHENTGITLVVTEGFGAIRMADKTFSLLQSCAGRRASVNGATQIRAGVMRPEVIVASEDVRTAHAAETAPALNAGALVRIIREPWFGAIGAVAALPVELVALPTESHARVLSVALDDGRAVTVPRANVEVIETR